MLAPYRDEIKLQFRVMGLEIVAGLPPFVIIRSFGIWWHKLVFSVGIGYRSAFARLLRL